MQALAGGRENAAARWGERRLASCTLLCRLHCVGIKYSVARSTSQLSVAFRHHTCCAGRLTLLLLCLSVLCTVQHCTRSVLCEQDRLASSGSTAGTSDDATPPPCSGSLPRWTAPRSRRRFAASPCLAVLSPRPLPHFLPVLHCPLPSSSFPSPLATFISPCTLLPCALAGCCRLWASCLAPWRAPPPLLPPHQRSCYPSPLSPPQPSWPPHRPWRFGRAPAVAAASPARCPSLPPPPGWRRCATRCGGRRDGPDTVGPRRPPPASAGRAGGARGAGGGGPRRGTRRGCRHSRRSPPAPTPLPRRGKRRPRQRRRRRQRLRQQLQRQLRQQRRQQLPRRRLWPRQRQQPRPSTRGRRLWSQLPQQRRRGWWRMAPRRPT